MFFGCGAWELESERKTVGITADGGYKCPFIPQGAHALEKRHPRRQSGALLLTNLGKIATGVARHSM